MSGGCGEFVDDLDGDRLDPPVWLAHYLPMWSSQEPYAASHRVHGSCLHLDNPVGYAVLA